MPVALVRGPSVLWRVGAHQFDRGVVMSQDRRVTHQIAGFLRGGVLVWIQQVRRCDHAWNMADIVTLLD
jgi:hypothetical protein